MAGINIDMMTLVDDPKVFSDIFNECLFHGELKVKSEELVGYESCDPMSKLLLKTAVIKTDKKGIYCIWGAGEQLTAEDMSITRMLLCDALLMNMQAEEIMGTDEKLLPVFSVFIGWEKKQKDLKNISDLFYEHPKVLHGVSYSSHIIYGHDIIEKYAVKSYYV